MFKNFDRQMCFNNILVSKRDYYELLEYGNFPIIYGLIDCIFINDIDYLFKLLVVSGRLYELGRLVYSNNGMSKASYEEYEKNLFTDIAEDINEFNERCKERNHISKDIDHDYRTFILLKESISKILCNASEVFYMCEYAGLIDFIVNRKEDLPDPNFGDSIFINNWKDYKPKDNDITKKFREKFML